MKKLLALLPIFFLVACGDGVVQVQGDGVDPEFEPYLEQFLIDAQRRGAFVSPNLVERLSIIFVEDAGIASAPDAVGACHHSTTTVVIERDWWEKANMASREVIVFHELGHCLLKLKHSENFIMKPDISPSYSIEGYFGQRETIIDYFFQLVM